MTNYQRIETSREIRQWVKGIILPLVAGAIYLDYMYPDLKFKLKDHFTRKPENTRKEQ